MNDETYKRVIGQYAEENANLKLIVAQLQQQLEEAKKKDKKDGE